MALSRIKTWIAEVLTAADLNAEFNNILNYINNSITVSIESGVTGLGTGVATLLSGTASGSGGPAGTTSPTFVTPVLGVASATSLAVTGGIATGNNVYLPAANTPGISANGALHFVVHAYGISASTNGLTTSLDNNPISGNQTVGSQSVVYARNTATTGFSANGMYIGIFSGAAPNDATTMFAYYGDTGGERASVLSNGGLRNFSANNVNLSDVNVKPHFERLSNEELDKLETAFVAVDWARYKYKDQTHNDWNYGYSAQGVKAAFAVANPAITDIWNPTTRVQTGTRKEKIATVDGEDVFEDVPVFENVDTPSEKQLLAVYENDLNNIGNALLARALVRVAALEQRVAALEGA